MQNIGDLMLANDAIPRLVFWKILEVEAALKKDHGDLIDSELAEGKGSADIVTKVGERARANYQAASTKQVGPEAGGEELRGPKPGQMQRALAEKSHAKLEAKYTIKLEARDTTVSEQLTIIGDSLVAETVLTTAVLFHSKGVRMSVYLHSAGADFLALLSGVRHLMPLYFGQTLAYDADLKAVPPDLSTFCWSDDECRRFLDFEWHTLDPLNECILKLRGELVA